MNDEQRELIEVFVHGWWESVGNRTEWQEGILLQLGQHSHHIQAIGTEPGSGAKPKSSPPGDLEALDLFIDARDAIRNEQYGKLKKLQTRARLLLGYDCRTIRLKDTVCGTCGGDLHVAEDASTGVYCNGTAETETCGTTYPRYTWVTLLGG